MAEVINFQFPKSEQLRVINPDKIADLQAQRPTFRIFPVKDYNVWQLRWRQRDNFRGFQQLRGLNGQPSYVRMVGWRQFHQEPAVFGERMDVDEEEMTTRADFTLAGGQVDAPVRIPDLVIERQEYLNLRETDLLEWQHWAMLLNGTFTLLGPNGSVYIATYGIQTVTFSDWNDLANGTPYADLLSLGALELGTSTNYTVGAEYWANGATVQLALLNRNPNDFGGMRIAQGIARVGVPANLADFNGALTAAGLGTLNTYNRGYNRESDGAFVTWLPNNVVSIWGSRPNGDPVGEYRMVRNINNPGNGPGRYTKVIDTLDREVPRRISVHQGHNGGLVLYYPSAIIRANV
jgi:hypothetical protein